MTEQNRDKDNWRVRKEKMHTVCVQGLDTYLTPGPLLQELVEVWPTSRDRVGLGLLFLVLVTETSWCHLPILSQLTPQPIQPFLAECILMWNDTYENDNHVGKIYCTCVYVSRFDILCS